MAESGALSYARRLLVKRDLLTAEVRAKLEAKRFDEREIDDAIAWLQEKRLLDDARAIEARIESLTSGKSAGGLLKVRAPLEAAGAPSKTFDASIGSMTDGGELERMAKLLAEKFKGERDRARGGRFLLSRGFEQDLVETALDRWIDA